MHSPKNADRLVEMTGYAYLLRPAFYVLCFQLRRHKNSVHSLSAGETKRCPAAKSNARRFLNHTPVIPTEVPVQLTGTKWRHLPVKDDE